MRGGSALDVHGAEEGYIRQTCNESPLQRWRSGDSAHVGVSGGEA